MISNVHITAVFLLATLINIDGLEPPRDVKILESELQWKPLNGDNVLYSLQYKLDPESEWLNVSSHIGTTLKRFKITPEYYGAVFRVRAEKENNISEWQYSNPVQCVHVKFCIPLINITFEPETAHLNMTQIDKSLHNEYGVHVGFEISYWKKDNDPKNPKVEQVSTSETQTITNLESGQYYCFQVEYLLYGKPYGNPSKEICEIIPETSETVRRRVLLYTLLITLFVSAVCVFFIFELFKHHKKVKQFFQPLHLEIPDHYLEVLYKGFPLEACPSPSRQSLQSYDMITVIESSTVEPNFQKEEQEQKSLT